MFASAMRRSRNLAVPLPPQLRTQFTLTAPSAAADSRLSSSVKFVYYTVYCRICREACEASLRRLGVENLNAKK